MSFLQEHFYYMQGYSKRDDQSLTVPCTWSTATEQPQGQVQKGACFRRKATLRPAELSLLTNHQHTVAPNTDSTGSADSHYQAE